MAGTGWKAVGTILIVFGSVLAVVGLATGILGGATASGAASDASHNDCGLLANEPCSSDANERFEAGADAAAAGMGGVLFGLLVVVLGIVLVYVGVARARHAAPRVDLPW